MITNIACAVLAVIAIILLVMYRILEKKYYDVYAKYTALCQIHEERKIVEDMVQKSLHINTQSFIQTTQQIQEGDKNLQKEIASNIHRTLENMNVRLGKMESERIEAQQQLTTHLQTLLSLNHNLHNETVVLSKALRAPSSKGQWGEMQLKRIVEMAGMLNHCDFIEQKNSEHNRMRPDMVIHLPGSKQIVIDAKTPLQAYLKSFEVTHESERQICLENHVKQLKQHIKTLSQKNYFEQFETYPEFVVLFLPSESIFSVALETDPSLIESAFSEKVVLATPTTLIALLKSIAYGWKQDNMEQNAKQIMSLTHEMIKRLNDLGEHFGTMGKALDKAHAAYHQSMRTYESRVLSTARKFEAFDRSLKIEKGIKKD